MQTTTCQTIHHPHLHRDGVIALIAEAMTAAATQVIQNMEVTRMIDRAATVSAQEANARAHFATIKIFQFSIKMCCAKTLTWFITEGVKL